MGNHNYMHTRRHWTHHLTKTQISEMSTIYRETFVSFCLIELAWLLQYIFRLEQSPSKESSCFPGICTKWNYGWLIIRWCVHFVPLPYRFSSFSFLFRKTPSSRYIWINIFTVSCSCCHPVAIELCGRGLFLEALCISSSDMTGLCWSGAAW